MKEAPKRFKYSRCFRLKLKNEIRESYLKNNIYIYGIKAVESGWLNSIQLNSLFRMIRIILEKNVEIKSNCALIIPITKKPLEVRMGSGKAERKFWKCPIFNGMILFELNNIKYIDFINFYKILKNRLPFKIKKIKLIF